MEAIRGEGIAELPDERDVVYVSGWDRVDKPVPGRTEVDDLRAAQQPRRDKFRVAIVAIWPT